jgi:hypothetical protein
MAVTRTVLPRKGLIQSQHGLTGYEADQDANWALLDANAAFTPADLVAAQLGINGLIRGFTLSTSSSSLTPGLTIGALFAQGASYTPATAPSIGAAPAGSTSYLFYNSSSGFYWQSSAVGAHAGDALVGQVTASATAVTSVKQPATIMGRIAAAPSASGNFTVQHFLGRAPVGAVIQMTSSGSIWFQPTTLWDATNLYLAASGAGITALVQIW